MTLPVTEKRCRHCESMLPVEEFDERNRICKECNKKRMRKYRRKDRGIGIGPSYAENGYMRKEALSFVSRNSKAMQDEALRPIPKVAQFMARYLSELKYRFGIGKEEGLDVLVRFQVDALVDSKRTHPGGVVEQRHLQMVWHALKDCQAMEDNELDMTPEQINERIKKMVEEVGRKHLIETMTTDDVAAAAIRLGFKVVREDVG